MIINKMDTKIISKIEEIFKIFKERDDYELEFKYDDKITKEKFNIVIDHYNKQKLKKEEITTLDIIFENKKINYRITIDNKELEKYSSTNKLTRDMIKEILIKQNISDYKPLIIKAYNLKLNLKEEKEVDDEQLIKSLLSILSRSLKGFRYKKRVSFIAKNYRIDLTIVRNYMNANPKSFVSNKTFSKDNISQEENYEIEIEAIKGENISSLDFSKIGIKLYELINKETKEDRIEIKEENAETDIDWMLPNRIGYGEKLFKNFPPEKYQQNSKLDCECKDEKCDIADKSVSLFPQQRLIKDYVQIDSPYRGAILYHELGSGKSGASIAAAEGYINKKKMFVLSPASLAVNYENEILKISSIGLNLKKDWFLIKVSKTNKQAMDILLEKYAIDKSIIKKDGLIWVPLYENDIPNAVIVKTAPTIDDKPLINQMISHIIRNRYTFISYNGLSANLIKNLGTSPFDNSFVIIDEVHNFSSRIVNGSKLAREIYSRLMNARDCRIILLSGTPIINNPYEVSTIINLIRGYMNIYELTFTKLTEEMFVKQMEKDDLMDVIDEYGIDQENSILYLSLLPRGYKRDKTTSYISKKIWGVDEEEMIDKIMKSLKIKTKPILKNYSALPNTRDEFNSIFLDNTDEENPKIKNEDLFMRRILGTLSYYSISNSDLFPKRLEDVTRFLYMTDTQFKKYTDVRAIERTMDNAKKGKGGVFDDKSSVYRAFSRMVCNFAFPEEINRLYPNDIKKAIKKEIDDDDKSMSSEIEIKDEPKAFELYEKKLKIAIQELLEKKYLTYEKTKNEFSPKFTAMLDDINDTKGSCLVYSQFRSVEGLGLFSEFLNMNGFKQIDLKKVDGEYYLTDEDIFDERYDNKRYVIFDQDRDKTKFLMNMFNGDFKNIPNEVIKFLPEDTNQLYGKIVKLFCITASGAEGISLQNVRAVLITEPYWNNIRIEQVIGRAIRSCSHNKLPVDQRNVIVYRYIMKFTKTQLEKDYSIQTLDKGITTDEHILLMANKKMAIINQFLKMLKASSFDCIINSYQNKPLENGYKCYSWALGVNKNDLAYTMNIKDDTKIMKHKKFQIAKRNKGRVVSKKGVKYVEMNGKLYNYYSYINAGILIPEQI
jgi:hypothetical protein